MTVLGQRALNRALLHRQWLAPRAAAGATAVDVAEHVAGLQAQAGDPPYYQLFTRIPGFRPGDLSRLLTGRAVVRVVLMRGTIHLVSARDALRLRAVMQPYLDKTLFNSSYGRKVPGVDPAEVAAAARKALADGPLHNDDLGARLAESFPGRDGNALAYLARSLLPLVQVPPRGLWGESGGLVYAHADQWLGAESETDPAPDDAILRYLAAYGPATVQDIQKWSSLSGLKAAVTRLRPQLVTYRNEHGKELYDLPDAPLPDPDTPVEPMLLAPFDNALLSHADRTRIIDKDAEKRVFTHNGMVLGTILLDGFVAGQWRVTRTKGGAQAELTPFAPLGKRDRAALEQRAEELLDFAADEGAVREVRFA
ncbi:winged helix DNA-binding domain-containing protein [Streptomyces boninensis]|uniref:winged helix DNA-binding domain-containing protein n=1 Tax=Streptomyces boninensis TaxID=2039455 RepID=UPI003B2164FF